MTSYRLWIRDLSQYFKEIGVKTTISRFPININNKTVIILDKLDVSNVMSSKISE